MLELKNISKSYGNPGETNLRTVLDNVNFKLEEGEIAAIIGPSGSGKTTLLNISGTLDFPDAGIVVFNNQEISSLSSSQMDHFRNKNVGFVFQFHHLLPQCTLFENVLIPTILVTDRNEKANLRRRAEELLKQTGIWEHKDKLPSKMSGGECQRAAIVRALINSPKVLLADEPTGALDSSNAENIMNLLLGMNKNFGLSLLIVTHSPEIAGRVDKTYHLSDGKLNLFSKK